MPGYLDHYGEGDELRERKIRKTIYLALGIVAVVVAAYLLQLNHKQKARVTEFVQALQRKDYASAYTYWGCTQAKPCPNYKWEKFLEDWGPGSPHADIGAFAIQKSRACGTGVIVSLDFGVGKGENLWVDGPELTIGFSPWPVCPPR